MRLSCDTADTSAFGATDASCTSVAIGYINSKITKRTTVCCRANINRFVVVRDSAITHIKTMRVVEWFII